jgi:L-alanine-DL-glutamate epimerase-like enolase superfamily enzyme
MAKIERVEILQVDLVPKTVRTDAIQSFATQETPMVRIHTSDGIVGTGYSYTIGTGGSSVIGLLRDHLAPRLLGRDPLDIEAIWKSLFFATHATAVGAITSLALAAIDTALWDVKCLAAGRPLWKEAGGAQAAVRVYSTEGGCTSNRRRWSTTRLRSARRALAAPRSRSAGPMSARTSRACQRCARRSDPVSRSWSTPIRPSPSAKRSAALGFTSLSISPGSRNRCRPKTSAATFAWPPRPRCRSPSASRSITRATSGNICSEACSIVQADVARIGGITPWLKVAHLAETFNVPICPHFLMELHVSLCAAVPNAAWVEWIPQLDTITTSHLAIEGGKAKPPSTPGIGIAWDWQAIAKLQAFTPIVVKA